MRETQFCGAMSKITGDRVIKCCELPLGHQIPVDVQSDPNSKVVVFLRHGQGFHNLAALEQPHRCLCCCSNGSPGRCPYSRPEHTDAELTPLGHEQAKSAGLQLRAAKPEFAFVSPLTRTLQTAHLALEAAADELGSLPMNADERLRERLGKHFCNKRRPLSYIANRFPNVDYSAMTSNEDALFSDEVWETDEEIAARSKRLFLDIAKRQEKCFLCVGHASLFSATLNVGFQLENSHGKYRFQFAVRYA